MQLVDGGWGDMRRGRKYDTWAHGITAWRKPEQLSTNRLNIANGHLTQT